MTAGFIEEEQRTVGRLKEHGIETGETLAIGAHAIGDFDGRRPLAVALAREPDADVGRAFAGAAEPRGDEPALRLHDGRGVAAWEWGGFEDEF